MPNVSYGKDTSGGITARAEGDDVSRMKDAARRLIMLIYLRIENHATALGLASAVHDQEAEIIAVLDGLARDGLVCTLDDGRCELTSRGRAALDRALCAVTCS